jgi:hypothetical protein
MKQANMSLLKFACRYLHKHTHTQTHTNKHVKFCQKQMNLIGTETDQHAVTLQVELTRVLLRS